jgi:hypothetical protein
MHFGYFENQDEKNFSRMAWAAISYNMAKLLNGTLKWKTLLTDGDVYINLAGHGADYRSVGNQTTDGGIYPKIDTHRY